MAIRKLSLMAYGDSGVGKSSQARYFAQYVWEKFGLRSRFIGLDGGSGSAPVDDLVEAGYVDVCLVPLSPEYNPFAIMRKFGRGDWPEGGIINKPTSMEVKNALGKVEVKYKTNTVWKPWTDHESKTIGLNILDSLTAYSTSYMFDAAVKNIRKGDDSNSTVRLEDGEQYGSNTMSHYGDVQNECKSLINNLVSLPSPFLYVTALGDAGTEDISGTKRPVLGPQVAGKAAIGEIPKLVTNCFHLTAEGNGTNRKVLAWYEDHPDSVIKTNNWRAKASTIMAEDRLEFVKKYPLGNIPLSLDKGIREFLEYADQLTERRVEKLKGGVK